MALFAKKKSARDLGSILLGFGILFFGVNLMSSTMEPLNDSPEFIHLLTDVYKRQEKEMMRRYAVSSLFGYALIIFLLPK